MATPVRTVFFGSGAFAVPAYRVLRGHPAVALRAVVTAPPRPAGRKGELRSTPVADAAEAAGTPVLTPTRLRDEAAVDAIATHDPRLIVLADYGRIVPEAILDLPPLGALNIHPSLLPRHRGATPVPAAILAGDAETGVTLMRMDAGLDTGPIVAQRRHPLDGTETTPHLEAMLAEAGAELLDRSLAGWIEGSLTAVPQDEAAASLTRPLRRADGQLDPQRPAVVLARQVRAYQPWPGSFLDDRGTRLVIWSARADAADGAGDAVGDLVEAGDGLALATADGRLVLGEVQPAGRRRMTAAAYRRGRRG